MTSRDKILCIWLDSVRTRIQHGNGLRYRGNVTLTDGNKRFSYDVFPAVASELNEEISLN